MERWLLLAAIFGIGFVAHNTSLMIATGFVMLLLAIPQGQVIMPYLNKKGISFGVTIITISILIPIATGQIGWKDLVDAFKSPLGWLGILCGILVAILSARGVSLINESPMVTIALTLGTIIGVVFFKGIAAGPIIAAGITYVLMQGVHFLLPQ
ncbi:DUF441 domain-containing protein [Hutsoniella sourekii]|uniref:DUF441 domain-containing protein n=1 Tax=Hutsoniella sourekii TaxID=87650 RepID=UPI00047FFE14|nr:DUF441 domain-containing protein [Hutsoniella sourekii]